MTVQFVGSALSSTFGGPTMTFNIPPGVQAGDLLLLQANGSWFTFSLTDAHGGGNPQGWRPIANNVYMKHARGDEGTSGTASHTSSSNSQVAVSAYRGVVLTAGSTETSDIAASATSSSPAAGDASVGPITIPADDHLLLDLITQTGSLTADSYQTPAGWTERHDSIRLALFDKVVGAGSTGTVTVVANRHENAHLSTLLAFGVTPVAGWQVGSVAIG